MRIRDLIDAHPRFVSLEFFPPKERETWPGFFEVVERLRAVKPLFVSVTYGAGGSTQDNSLDIVCGIKADHGLEPLAHLTCVGATEDGLEAFLSGLDEAGIANVLALRGDPPRDAPDFSFAEQRFQHATDLVAFIRERHPGFCVGAAAYPEAHPESCSIAEDLDMTVLKVRSGADFLVTQLFFDNRMYFDFVERLERRGASVPVVPGVLPILSIKSAKFILGLCGAAIPGNFLAALERAHAEGGDEAVARVGLEHAKRQARELLDGGAPGVHLYTLNRAEACLEIAEALNHNPYEG